MDELKQLKELLLGDEQRSIDDLEHRLNDSRSRTEDVAEVLPHAIRQSSEQNDLLARSLQQPVEECLNTAIRKDTSTFADVLFPVMGPAIRRSIVETLRGMLQSINKTLDESFSLRGLSWRFESMRTGVPFYDIVLRNTLVYRVEQIFLIQPDTGLLMHHMTAPDVPTQDPDAVSAMLTAIEDFASDSFSQNREGDELQTVNIGEHTLWLFHGPHALLASVIRGVPPISLRERFSEALELIHKLYSKELAAFDGNRTPINPVENILADCFVSEQKDKGKNKRSISFLLVLIVLGLLGLLAWWSYQSYLARTQRISLVNTLNSTPGIVVLNNKKQGDQIKITGLKDPFSDLPTETIEKMGYGDSDIEYIWHKYQSDEPELALARAKQLLSTPETVDLELLGTTLVAQGRATKEWVTEASILSKTIAGIDHFDGSRIYFSDAALLEHIRTEIKTPDSVKLTLNQDLLSVEGVAPNQWLIALRGKLAAFHEIKEIETHNTHPLELDLANAAISELEAINVMFDAGSATLDSSANSLVAAKELILSLIPLFQALDEKFVVEITGSTDGTGSILINQELSMQRSEVVKQWMTDQGLEASLFTTSVDISSIWDSDSGDVLQEHRRAHFVVKSNLIDNPGQ